MMSITDAVANQSIFAVGVSLCIGVIAHLPVLCHGIW